MVYLLNISYKEKMEQKKFKKLLCVMLVAILCVCSVGTVLGTVGSKTITVNYNDIKLIVDEKAFTPMDSAGNMVEPFLYNGTTYLPVRAVAEAVGKEVNWDASTKTVVIGKYVPPGTEKAVVKIEDMDRMMRFSNDVKTSSREVTDNFRNKYNGYLELNNDGFIEYALDGKYSKLKGTLILEERFISASPSATFSIILDGKTVETFNAVKKDEIPFEFEISLAGVNTLRITATSTGAAMNKFVEMGLYK